MHRDENAEHVKSNEPIKLTALPHAFFFRVKFTRKFGIQVAEKLKLANDSNEVLRDHEDKDHNEDNNEKIAEVV